MAIEIIPKPPAKIPFWQKFWLYFSIAFLGLAILSCFIFNNIFKKTLQASQDLEKALAKMRTPQVKILEKEILNYQKKIKDFSALADGHLASSNFFIFLEKLSHPQVWFLSLDLRPREAKVSLSGEAENFPVLGQQILIFKKEKRISDLKLSKVSLVEGGKIRFDLSFSLSPEIFQF